jgi:serine/threonine-protein kinase
MTFPDLGPEYIIIRHIESGGEADVYELRHSLTASNFAGRVLREGWDPLARASFADGVMRQMRATGPGVVPVLAFNFEAPQPFAVMEFMRQGSLADEIARRKGPFPVREALSVAHALATTLGDVHHKKLAHLDFKPGNILKAADGGWRLSDFGAAVTVSSKEILRAPRWVCTPEYAAPEQLKGLKSQASDVYALGVVLTELLTGKRKLDVGDLLARVGSASTEVATLIARLTAADARARPTAREAVGLLAELERRLPGRNVEPAPVVAVATRPAPAPAPAPKSSALPALGAVFGGLLTAALLNRATKTWDPNVDRYRGSDGSFRGGGFFD